MNTYKKKFPIFSITKFLQSFVGDINIDSLSGTLVVWITICGKIL
jgi:hypothetical protein